MVKYFFILTITYSLFFEFSYGQTLKNYNKQPYSIDDKVKDEIEKKIASRDTSLLLGAIDFKIFENDSLVVNSYDSGKSIECITMAMLTGDTINISGFLGMTASFGFGIALFGDTCVVRHFAGTDMPIFKYKKTDSLTFAVSVPCREYKLTLVNKPKPQVGEVVEGKIELLSDDYYEVANGLERKYKMQLTGYFKGKVKKL